MKNCIEEGTLQAWFDGELAADEAASVAAHVKTCARCADVASTVEAESLILSEALGAEFVAPVPTEALRQRVDSAVARLRYDGLAVKPSRWSVFAELFSFRRFAYASVAAMVLFVAIVGFIYLKNQKTTPIANNNRSLPVSPEAPKSPNLVKDQSPEQPVSPQAPKPSFVAGVRTPKQARRTKDVELDATSITWQERQYENAIAKLHEALKIQPPMQPALQVEYEYNMAVIDSAIASTRDVARKKPKDPLANQYMLAAYQSKIDFMNQIADARALQK